ncbi:hypothetical protein PsorP6_012140 [Peronosclerospora sorghi]|uniref:Uncharacterized protein n=1 Tax=Peronosclerospora sorghi TaxID=230839 RepID=A0ACC0WNA6_9STRA|nr:hypothetical protein PsorP6_012140 [Peronosclerospora sorghi]
MSESDDGPRAGDTLRVLLSTDNHLGYAEKDPVRGNDSFRSFREILQLAQQEKVDLLLLGGDLFHENKPSRRTLYETMRLLRHYCMGDGAVQFQVVSDQSVNFPNFGIVNFEDPNYNVELPIFSIHGNHDDPTREAGGNIAQSLAALDLLSAANLINYFGKSEKVDAVEVLPVLLTKGNTRVAIYGLGNMRDERLNRMFAQGNVVFRRPVEQTNEWFSIFVVHQNRDDRGRGSKNCIPESVIPDFIDLVVWGHEHECLVDAQESVNGDFYITQPGSSVATSLVEGEAKTKHVALLEVNGQSFRMFNRELHTVRHFKMGEVVLSEIEELEPNDPDVAERIDAYLESRVVELLGEAELEQQERVRERAKEYEKRHQRSPFPVPKIANEEKEKELVLVRLRVEHTGFPVLINQRFGAKFVGKVANPNDILLFHRRKKERINMDFDKPLLSRPVRPSPLVAETIEDILRKQLSIPERKLVLLPEAQLGIALESFTFRSNASAIQEFVDSVLDATQHELSSHRDAKSAKDILSVVEKKMEQTDALDALQKEESELGIDTADSDVASRTNLSAVGFRSKRAMHDDSRVAKAPPGRFGTPLTPSNKRAASKTNTAKVSSIFSDLEDNSDTSPRGKKTSTPRKASARSTRSKQQAKRTSLLFDDNDLSGDDDGDEDYEVEEDAEEEKNTSRRTSRGRAVKKSIPNRKRLRKSRESHDEGEQDNELIRSIHKPKRVKPAKQASQASEVLKSCSESDPEYSERVSKPKAKRSRQLKVNHLAKNQELKKNEEDDVESDHEFTELARPTDASTLNIVGPSQSQTASQISQPRGGCLTRRKLPLSMSTAASQSQSQVSTRGGAATAARKGWGRSRR